MSIGSVAAAVPLSRRMARLGRRRGLVWGWSLGAAGAMTALLAAVLSLYPELDGRDTEPATRHCWVPGTSAGRPELPIAAYARGLDQPGGGTKIGRVVTHPAAHDQRRSGLLRTVSLGGLLVNHLVQTTSGPWTLDAQARLADWYRGLGFSPAGQPFDDWGMLHVPMRLDVRADSMLADQSRHTGR